MVGRTALLTRISRKGDEGSGTDQSSTDDWIGPLAFRFCKASMVKWRSCPASNGMFWVRVLVEALKKQRKGLPMGAGHRLETGWGRKPLAGSTPAPSALGWCSWCSGSCMSACEAEGDGSIPFEHPKEEREIVVAMLTRLTLGMDRQS